MSLPEPLLHIDGQWRPASTGETMPVYNPATEEEITRAPVASLDDLAQAAETAWAGFLQWREVPAFDRSKMLRKAASLLRERADPIARVLTTEQGKPLSEAEREVQSTADTLDWFAEEARRIYGRTVPGRQAGVSQLVSLEPVGPVAAFTPWNFPLIQAVRKLAAALAAGCSVILKAPENTPASCVELVRALLDAGIPGGAVTLLFGRPDEISGYLIAHPRIRKISFTGSTAVGKHLAALAGTHMKRATMELGGHAPAIVCADSDLDKAVAWMGSAKYRNAGQVCIAPTRFLVQRKVYDEFVERYVDHSRGIVLGNGLEPGVTMGPLAHQRRMEAMSDLVSDARLAGGEVLLGGKRWGNSGYFFEPTIMANIPHEARMQNEEPFGPVSILQAFGDEMEAIEEANRVEYGLAAYVFTQSPVKAAHFVSSIESGSVSVNHQGIGLPENPFGGIKASGYGLEGGAEGIEPYLNVKFVTQTFG